VCGEYVLEVILRKNYLDVTTEDVESTYSWMVIDPEALTLTFDTDDMTLGQSLYEISIKYYLIDFPQVTLTQQLVEVNAVNACV